MAPESEVAQLRSRIALLEAELAKAHLEPVMLRIRERTGACLFEVAPPATVGQPLWEVTAYRGGPRTGEGKTIHEALLDLERLLIEAAP